MYVRLALASLIVVVHTVVSVRTVSGQASESALADCRQGTVVARLARIYGSADISMIEKETRAVCESGKTQSTIRWSNKERMKSASGWFYPNTNDAIRSAGTWLYPNEHIAKSAQGMWSYPDGKQAKLSRGDWTRPDRHVHRLTTAELRTWACSRVPTAACAQLSSEIGDGNTDEEILAALELAWLAR